ncbi:MAG: hypothetical protein NVSMB46_03670 [Candidatus Saccharimonadales bacterium]
MNKRTELKLLSTYIAVGAPVVLTHTALAATGDIGSIEGFIKSIITVLAGLAGLVATGFFVIGGFSYITSTGHPERLDKAKKTILYSAIGLAITIGAFVLSNIVTGLATKAFGS